MMAKCVGSKKASITIEGPLTVVSFNPGVDVELIPPGGMRITLAGIGVKPDYSPENLEQVGIDPNGTENDNYTMQTAVCTVEMGCGAKSPSPSGQAFVQARILKNGVIVHKFAPLGWYSVAVKSIEKIKGEIKISDATGLIWTQEFLDTPSFTISCDDDCPEGQIKGHSNRPPGYCCLPCGDIRDDIASIKSMLRI